MEIGTSAQLTTVEHVVKFIQMIKCIWVYRIRLATLLWVKLICFIHDGWGKSGCMRAFGTFSKIVIVLYGCSASNGRTHMLIDALLIAVAAEEITQHYFISIRLNEWRLLNGFSFEPEPQFQGWNQLVAHLKSNKDLN